jgi:hypothetical protein
VADNTSTLFSFSPFSAPTEKRTTRALARQKNSSADFTDMAFFDFSSCTLAVLRFGFLDSSVASQTGQRIID